MGADDLTITEVIEGGSLGRDFTRSLVKTDQEVKELALCFTEKGCRN